MTSSEDDNEDQIVAHLGIIGPWQWRIISIVAVFCIPLSCHIFIMTFMNAQVPVHYEGWSPKLLAHGH